MKEIEYRAQLITDLIGKVGNSVIKNLIVGLCAEVKEGLTGNEKSKITTDKYSDFTMV